MSADDFWKPFEVEVSNFEEARDVVHSVFDRWSAEGKRFAWRGHVDAVWPLWSSLYRRLTWTEDANQQGGSAPDEKKLYAQEGDILADVHRWGLHMGDRGRLSVLNQLAVLQHYGSPTRLIDVTFNPYIGLWFAVEQRWSNGKPNDEIDGRWFAIDITDRLINETDERRCWEDDLKRPWPNVDQSTIDVSRAWQSGVYAWQAPKFDRRIAAQNGGFIFGGVPSSQQAGGNPRQWPKAPGNGSGWWSIDEVRRSTSIALRPHVLNPQGGGVSSNAVYSVRVKANAKKDIRERLEKLFGYNHSAIYPDYTGFASFGTPTLRNQP